MLIAAGDTASAPGDSGQQSPPWWAGSGPLRRSYRAGSGATRGNRGRGWGMIGVVVAGCFRTTPAGGFGTGNGTSRAIVAHGGGADQHVPRRAGLWPLPATENRIFLSRGIDLEVEVKRLRKADLKFRTKS